MARPQTTTLADDAPELAAELVNPADAALGCGSAKLVEWRCPKGHIYTARPYNRTAKKNPTGCPVCAGRKVVAGVNDLATTHPEAAAQLADPALATQLTALSNKKVEWRCKRGHIWAAPPSRITGQGSGCPYCSGRLAIPGETDLATTHPALAAQLADPALAKTVVAGSSMHLTWVCPECGWQWQATVCSRARNNTGCPACAKRSPSAKEFKVERKARLRLRGGLDRA